MDKGSINIFEVKTAKKDIPYKISAAEVYNDFLYLGDEKGKHLTESQEPYIFTRSGQAKLKSSPRILNNSLNQLRKQK